MYNFPQNTRNDNKKDRENFSMPSALPSPVNPTYGEAMPGYQPNYDRNMFSGGMHIEMPQRKMTNDRFFETSEIYKNFGQSTPTQSFQTALTNNNIHQVYTRERRDERMSSEEKRNMDRIFLNSRDYNSEVNDRLNGFGMIARDTRYDSKKIDDGKMEMRCNRYLGMPGENI